MRTWQGLFIVGVLAACGNVEEQADGAVDTDAASADAPTIDARTIDATPLAAGWPPGATGFPCRGGACESNATTDFSKSSNPTGLWTYGWSPTRGGTFAPFDNPVSSIGLDVWNRAGDPNGAPAISHN